MKSAETLPETGYVRLKKVLKFIPVSHTTFLKWVKDGIAPEPVRLGPRVVVWRAEDIHQLIADLPSKPEFKQ